MTGTMGAWIASIRVRAAKPFDALEPIAPCDAASTIPDRRLEP
jgi:hypothetical protein